MDEIKIYTIEELEKILKIPQYSIRKYLREGKLKGSKIGKHWRVTQEQLKDFLKDNSNDANDIISKFNSI